MELAYLIAGELNFNLYNHLRRLSGQLKYIAKYIADTQRSQYKLLVEALVLSLTLDIELVSESELKQRLSDLEGILEQLIPLY